MSRSEILFSDEIAAGEGMALPSENWGRARHVDLEVQADFREGLWPALELMVEGRCAMEPWRVVLDAFLSGGDGFWTFSAGHVDELRLAWRLTGDHPRYHLEVRAHENSRLMSTVAPADTEV